MFRVRPHCKAEGWLDQSHEDSYWRQALSMPVLSLCSSPEQCFETTSQEALEVSTLWLLFSIRARVLSSWTHSRLLVILSEPSSERMILPPIPPWPSSGPPRSVALDSISRSSFEFTTHLLYPEDDPERVEELLRPQRSILKGFEPQILAVFSSTSGLPHYEI